MYYLLICIIYVICIICRIPFAQAGQTPPAPAAPLTRLDDDIYICGDYCNSATLNGAFESGYLAAQAIVKQGIKDSKETL